MTEKDVLLRADVCEVLYLCETYEGPLSKVLYKYKIYKMGKPVKGIPPIKGLLFSNGDLKNTTQILLKVALSAKIWRRF